MTAISSSSSNLRHSGRAALLDILSRAFAYPDRGFYDALSDGSFMAALEEGVEQADAVPNLSSALGELAGGVAETLKTRNHEELETEYIALFELNRDQPPMHMYGGLYGEAEDVRLKTLQRLKAIYREYGLELEQGAEQADHLTVELEFLAFLYGRSAGVQEDGTGSTGDRIAQDIRSLVRELKWTQTFVKELEERSDHPLYLPLGRLLTAVLVLL